MRDVHATATATATATTMAPPTVRARGRTAPPPRERIVWLAVAEGRGHLMRAQLAARLLEPAGIDVEIVTTSQAGVAFMAEFGLPASVVSTSYRLLYDGQQNLARLRTHAMAVTYLVSPRRCLRDLAWLEGRAAGAALIVNDSFHPALLTASLVGKGLADRVVHVHGENTRRAVEASVGRGPIRAMVRRALTRSTRIEITLGDRPRSSSAIHHLPPLLPMPRPREAVRAELGVRAGQRLAVVYLNPYFHDVALAGTIEAELATAGYHLHAVGEGFADRPGWRARDAALGEAVAAADLFVSAAGVGALALARASGVPMIALATDQPEQRRNLAASQDRAAAWRTIVDLGPGARDLQAAFAAAVASVPHAFACPAGDAELAARRARSLWLTTLTTLVERNRHRKDPS